MRVKERTFFEIIGRFLRPYLQNRAVTGKGMVFYGIWAVGPIMHIYFIEKVIASIENKDIDQFITMMLWYLGVVCMYYVAAYISKMWGWVITVCGYRRVIHREYLEKFTVLSNTEAEKVGTGKLISIIGTGMDTWAVLLDAVLNNALKIIVTVIFTFYMISVVNIWAAIIFIVSYIIVHTIGEYFNRKSLKYRRKRQDSWNEYTGNTVKMIMSKFEILQTGKTDSEIDKIDVLTGELEHYNRKMAIPSHWFYYVPGIFINFVKLAMFAFLGHQVILGNQPMSLFVVLFGVLTLMNNVIVTSMQFYSRLTKDFTKIEKLWDFFDTTPDIKGYDTGNEFKYKTGKISLEDIEFGYSTKQKVFEKFTLDVEGGKVTALVGNSGSGKSTLVKLISGYIRQDAGTIMVDDQNLETVSLKSYYKNIGYLTQEPNVFDGTIRDNLMYAVDTGHPQGVTLQKKSCRDTPCRYPELDTVIKQAKCEFIYDLENGLDTEIGEKGIRLSGGQRQRLAIAKIFLKNPKIIILDEPTSALDSFSEEQITKAMHNLFRGRTVIIIAHRLQTVKNADRILVLENGKVSEEGSHKELIKQKGIYKKMLDLQSGF